MKFGLRTPSLKKSWSARTTGRLTRSAKRAVIPGYGKKGAGWVKNPKKAATNAVYKRTTVGVSDMTKSTVTSKNKGENAKESKETTALISANNDSNNNKGGSDKKKMKKLGFGALAVFGVLMVAGILQNDFWFVATFLLVLLSLVAFVICLIWGGINFLNKKPTKGPLKMSGIAFVAFWGFVLLGGGMLEAENEQLAQTPPPTTAVVASVETTQEITTTLETTTVLETTAETTTIATQETQSGGRAGAEKATTKASTKAPTKKAVATTKKATSGRSVYVSSKGKRYHFSSSCSSGNYSSIDINEAKNRGYTPCKKCAGG